MGGGWPGGARGGVCCVGGACVDVTVCVCVCGCVCLCVHGV